MAELDFDATADRIADVDEGSAELDTAPADEVADSYTDTEDDVLDGEADTTDYARLAAEDLEAIRREFREARELTSLTDLDDPVRFAELRELGLTPREAYLATRKPKKPDNRSHLSGAAPRSAGSVGSGMTQNELLRARELFSGMSDREIQSLYKRVSAR